MNITAPHPLHPAGSDRKVYDIFTFFNELDLLEIRLNILDPYVDYFVIVESTQTFSGRPKKLYFAENRQRFVQFADKIIHYVVNDTPDDWDDLRQRLTNPRLNPLDKEIINEALSSDNIKPGVVHWLKEFYQKESIKKALVNLADDDICFVSDVDEIWNPQVVPDFTDGTVYKFRQHVYSYFLNNRSDEPWAGTLATTYKTIRQNCLNHLRTVGKTNYSYVDNGGWHFTNMGDADYLRQKIEASYSADDLNTRRVKSRLAAQRRQNKDYLGREFRFWHDDTQLPKYLQENRVTYKHLYTLDADVGQPKYIIIKIQAGLGNQLFQYALGRSLAFSHGANVQYDISWYQHQKKRTFDLQYFHTIMTIAAPADTAALKKFQSRPGLLGIIYNILIADLKKYVQEKNHNFDKQILETSGPAYLDGFWQSENYFAQIGPQLKQELQVKKEPTGLNAKMLSDIKNQNSIAVHIRRGDYVTEPLTNQFHGVPSLSYYRQAIKYVAEHVDHPVFYFFSDDLPWVKENLKIEVSSVFVDHNGPDRAYEDLRLMMSCKHHIIANSSFSWWGAWLAEHPGQIVIAPKQWFATPDMDARDVVPERWLRM